MQLPHLILLALFVTAAVYVLFFRPDPTLEAYLRATDALRESTASSDPETSA